MDVAYELDDPRPIAVASPYTYFLPSDEELASIGAGDSVQLLFRSLAELPKYDVERMWVLVQLVSDEGMAGILQSKPFDMPGVEQGERVRFERYCVIDILFQNEVKQRPSEIKPRRQFWERCLVDRCVLDDGAPVGFLYREAANLQRDGDRDVDSGWRIRGDARGLSEEEVDARKCEYIAVGKVLNRDDSWLPLIDEPVGSAFRRDFSTGIYERQTDVSDD